MPATDSARFWDARARENALYFVDSELDYTDPDEREFWVRGDAAVRQILEAVEARVEPGDRIVDVGCGLGRLTRALATLGGTVIGIDVSAEMLRRAETLNEGLEKVMWIQGDGSTLHPIADDSIDLCFSHVVFQHIPDPRITAHYIYEMGRVLRPGGRAVFVLSTDPSVHRQRPSVRQRLRSLAGRAPRGGDSPAWLGSALTEAELEDAVATAGMSIARIVGLETQFTIVRAELGR